MLVRIIPTGQAELLAMADALAVLFPDHQFECVAWRPPGDPFPGFTSNSLASSRDADGETIAPRPEDRLVAQLVAELVPDQPGRRQAADMALVVDDLELCNVEKPELVVRAMRAAVRRHLNKLRERDAFRKRGPNLAERAAQVLRERASLHLAVPMLEAWFFATEVTLIRAGVPEHQLPPKLMSGRDLEAFATDDPAYRCADGSECTRLHEHNRRRPTLRRRRVPWCIEHHDEHPKAYLSWLCRDPADRRCTGYRETGGGAEALRHLAWPALLSTPGQCRYVRALVRDIADCIGEPAPHVAPEDRDAALTSRFEEREQPLLRNM